MSELQPPRLWAHRVTGRTLLPARRRPSRAHRALGAALSVFTALVVIWVVVGSVPSAKTGVVGNVQRSAIVRRLNTVAPPPRAVLKRKPGAANDKVGFFIGNEPEPADRLAIPNRALLEPAIATASRSTVEVTGSACGTTTVGSGVVIDTRTVITSAHVIAGMGSTTVVSDSGRNVAIPVLVDPQNDVAILRVNSLNSKPLPLRTDLVERGTATALLGYPRGGQLQSDVAVVLADFNATGHDIYGQGEVRRSVYELQATILPGESGGPLVDADGALVGLVFAASSTHADIGYALAGSVIRDALESARTLSEPVSTGDCVPA